MKKILSASICAIALSAAIPAFAADDAKPMHHKHHMMKSSSKMGPHTKMKMKGDPTTEELNAKSLDAARGGSTTDTSATPAAPAAPAAPMAPPASGTDAGTAPMNAPAGH
jgi:hypothetical protein